MEKELIHLADKRLEKRIPAISAKVADATDLLQSAVEAKILLLEVQRELEDLYTAIGDTEGSLVP